MIKHDLSKAIPSAASLKLRIQCLPQDPADVNALKTMLDPYILVHKSTNYCPYTVFEKLTFSKPPFSETSAEIFDHVILLHPKGHKDFENLFTNENFMPKNILDSHFECTREAIQTH